MRFIKKKKNIVNVYLFINQNKKNIILEFYIKEKSRFKLFVNAKNGIVSQYYILIFTQHLLSISFINIFKDKITV